jgi:hypothetical protein
MSKCLSCLSVSVLICLGSADASTSGPRLSITLEDSPALQYQTLYVVICVENRTSGTIPDVAPLSPGKGFLQLELLRDRDGLMESIPLRGPSPTYVARDAGPSLAAGDAMCEARDLLVYFGEAVNDSGSAFTRLGWPSLPPGKYRLVAVYDLHTGFDRSIQQQRLSADTLQFEVIPISAVPVEERLLAEFMAGTAQYGTKTTSYFAAARKWLPRFYRSHFLFRIFLESGPEMSRSSIETLLDNLAQHGVSPTKRATLIGIGARVDPRALERDPRTYSKLRAHATSDVERKMINSWEKAARGGGR